MFTVMIEKWMLVLLIVGCTSLVFLICFPIDFYLYRRRRRLARERKNLTMYRPQTQSNRAAQIHAKVTVAEVAAEVDFEEMNRKDRKVYRAQRGIMRFLSLIRKKDKQTPPQHSRDFISENSSECRVLTTPDTANTLAQSDNKNYMHQSTSTRSRDFGELIRDTNASTERTASQESKLGFAISKDMSGDSSVWRENKELVDRDGKQQNYGAFRPLENMVGANDSTESRSLTIPVRSRSIVIVKSENDNGSNNAINDHTGSHQDIIVESKSDYDRAVRVNSVYGRQETELETHLSVDDDNRKVYTPIQEYVDSDNETDLQQHENLVLSNSDQSLSYNSKQSKALLKPRRKGNAISPTNKLTSSHSEQFRMEEKESSALSNKRTLSLSTTLEEPSASAKRKKKKDSTFNKQSSDSMPELQRYQKERF